MLSGKTVREVVHAGAIIGHHGIVGARDMKHEVSVVVLIEG
jgi:hypothetical protein